MIRRSTLILLGIFLILVLVAFFIQRSQDREGNEATPTPGVTLLIDTGGKTITGMRITASDGDLLELIKDAGGGWELVNLPDEAADETRIESAISNIEGLRVLSELESPPDLDVIALDPAAYSLTITLDDGSEIEAFIGAETPTQSGYYARQNGDKVVVVNGFNIDSLLELLSEPPILKTPTPSSEPEESITPGP
jgi:Domain of unknown function (DUF4340)